MVIKEYTEPYHHIVIDDFLPKNLYEEIKNCLYAIDCGVPEIGDYTQRFGEIPACVPVGSNVGNNGYIEWNDSDKYIHILTEYIENFFEFSDPSKNYNNSQKIKTISNKFKWSGYYEIARDSFAPHTDNAWLNLINDKYYAGIIKGVVYFAEEGVDYTNYGTILFDNKSKTFVKEVEFIPNRLILFDTRDDSLHATDYHGEMRSTDVGRFRDLVSNKTTQLKEKRFSFNIEYHADQKNLSPDEVDKLYKDIEYPNARILEWWINGKNLDNSN